MNNQMSAPIFGHHDIVINSESFNKYNKSFGKFPKSYLKGSYKKDEKASNAFFGRDATEFHVEEWEVLKVNFS